MKKFPTNGLKLEDIKAELQKLSRSWEKTQKPPFGSIITRPDEAAIEAYKILLESNYNNIGFVDNIKNPKIEGTNILNIEAKVLSMMCNLYHGKDCNGYITSGGTEGNLMGLWLGRENLWRKGKILVIYSELAHYSVEKCCNILRLKNISKIPLDSKYGMNISELEKLIANDKKHQGYIIVSTLGYSETGTIDDIKNITNLIRKYKKKGKSFYLHVDAAVGGFVIPFSNPMLAWNFSLSEVNSISSDAHKIAAIPYPAGIFIARKTSFLTPRKIKYTGQLDSTFLGSRPGVSAAAIYAVLMKFGFNGFHEMISRLLKMKLIFVRNMKKYNAVIIDSKYMNSLAIAFPKLGEKGFEKQIEEKYSLNKISIPGKEGLAFYSIYFMPHVTTKMLDDFMADLSRCLNG